MKSRFLLASLLVLLFGCVFNVSAQENEYDVFLLIGQSNMAGRGYMIDGDKEVIHKNVYILDTEGNVVPAPDSPLAH